MSSTCPPGQTPDIDRTAFGQCLDIARTPRVRVPASARPAVPSRPVPDPTRQGSGLLQFDRPNNNSPDPVASSVARTVWHHLTAGLAMLSLNDHGRDWPLPRRDRLAVLLAEFDDDLCIWAAEQARDIVQSQDRAPNITSLFEMKLRERAQVRDELRDSLGAAA